MTVAPEVDRPPIALALRTGVWGVLCSNTRGLRAGMARELRDLPQSPDRLMALVTAPLLTLIFLSIMRHAGREDLTPFAVLAPALVVLWQMALQISGDSITSERDNGSLEAVIATPTPLHAVIGGRIVAITLVSLLGFAESWLAAALLFGIRVDIEHPVAFAAAILATGWATAGSAIMLSPLFVASRVARNYQNTLTYPFYILGGVIVPVSYLPHWLEPVSWGVFLSWSSDLLRAALDPAPIERLGPRLAVIVLLGLAGLAVGQMLMRAALGRVRRTGSIGYD